MAGYVKLFSKILDSTIWAEDSDTKVVWITMLAMADRDGIVECTVPGLAGRAKVSLEKTEKALVKFQNPDKYSWSQVENGRRIRKIDRGWLLINYESYREMLSADKVREQNRKRQERYRERKRSVTVTHNNAPSRHASASATTTVNLNTKAYTPPVTNLENPPENLHPVNYATKILEDLNFPHTQDNLRTVAAAVEAEMKSGKSGPAAYEFVRAGALDAKDEGWEINRFFFSDAKYRVENRRNGHGRGSREISASEERSNRSKQNILDGFAKNARRSNTPDNT